LRIRTCARSNGTSLFPGLPRRRCRKTPRSTAVQPGAIGLPNQEDGPMRRREFIAGLGAAAALPLVGYLQITSPEVDVNLLAAFRKGLAVVRRD
jgi:hypothetical protein